jgi:hypothetical protein
MVDVYNRVSWCTTERPGRLLDLAKLNKVLGRG